MEIIACVICLPIIAWCLYDNRPQIVFYDHPDRIAERESEERMEVEAARRWEALREEWRSIAARVLVDPLVDLEERIFEAPDHNVLALA